MLAVFFGKHTVGTWKNNNHINIFGRLIVGLPENAAMPGEELKKQIEDLLMVIALEEENYKTALQTQLPYETLKQMRLNIKKLKGDLQVLLDQQSVQKTGELPEGGVS